ncbi:MAG: PAS domain-containing protein [Chthoniobacterales bacterium]
MIHWLLVSSSEAVAEQVDHLLAGEGIVRFRRHSRVGSLEEATKLVATGAVSIVIVDLGEQTDLERLGALCQEPPLTPVLGISDREGEEYAVRVVKTGAQDCLRKSRLTPTLLKQSMRYAVERIRIERELSEERDLLRALLDSIPDRIYFKDRKSRFLRVSRELANFFRLDDPADAVGKTDFDFFSEEHARPAFEDEQGVVRTGEGIVGKIEKETFDDGRVGWVTTTKLPLRNASGKIVGTCGISRDISDLKALEDILAAERNLLRSVIDHVPDPIFAKDATGRYLMSNAAHARRVGAEDPDAVLGHVAKDFLPDESAEVFLDAEREVFESGEPQLERSEHVELPDGSVRWLVTTRVPLEIDGGEVRSLVCVGRDVTSQKEAQDALERANEDLAGALGKLKRAHADLRSTQLQLIEAEKMKSIGRLAAGVAHEVKNPLAIISMGLEFLNSQKFEREEIPAVLADLRDAVSRADAVIKGLLDFSAPKNLELRPHDLNEIIRKALRLVRGEAKAGQLKVELELEEVPPLEVDRLKVGQIFVNLFTNAIHAMDGAGTLTIRTRVEQVTRVGANISGERSEAFRAGQQVAIVEVLDSGSGFPDDKLTKVFEPFYTTKPTGKGTGLGMAVVKSIVDLHGGTVEISNRNEGGARVVLAFKASLRP